MIDLASGLTWLPGGRRLREVVQGDFLILSRKIAAMLDPKQLKELLETAVGSLAAFGNIG
jgi:hypothetical protein